MNERVLSRLALLTLAVGLCVSCPSPRVQSQLVDQTLFAQATVFASRDVVSAANYRQEVAIPVGSPITVLAVDPERIRFQVNQTGHEYVFVNHRATGMAIEGAFTELFGPSDPAPKLAALEEGQRAAVLAGQALPGMTKGTALLALGKPPRNETPSTDLDTWTYWRNRFAKMIVVFENGIVVDRAAAPEPVAPAPAPAPAPAKNVMYARCNVHYEDGVASWVNYLRGPIVKFNSAIEVLDQKRDEVEFRLVDGGVELHFANEEAKSGQATWTLFTRLFAAEDQAPRLAQLSADDQKRVAAAEVTQGMTRAAVEMALCPPPPHATTSLDASAWIYWTSRVNREKIVFNNDGFVSRVEQ